MKIIFIRHGKPDYSIAKERGFCYTEKNFSPLHSEGIRQAEAAAADPRLTDADIILSSPFTRALQTAEIINQHLQKKLIVEYDLHEWAVALNGNTRVDETETLRRYFEYKSNNGETLFKGTPLYENAASIVKRGKSVFEKYTHHNKIIVVSHGTFIMSLIGRFEDVPLCGIIEWEFK